MKISLNCWQHVCTFAGAAELLALSLTCKAINRLTARPELWERLVVASVGTDPFVMVPVNFTKPNWKRGMLALLADACQRTGNPFVMTPTRDSNSGWTCFVTGNHELNETLELGHMALTVQGIGQASFSMAQGPIVRCIGAVEDATVLRGLLLRNLPAPGSRFTSLIEVDGDGTRLTVDQCVLQGSGEGRGSAITICDGHTVDAEDERCVASPNVAPRLWVTGSSFAGFTQQAIVVLRRLNDHPGGLSGELRNCRFSGCGMALQQDGPGHWIVSGCVFEGTLNRTLSLMMLGSLAVTHCRIEGSKEGCDGGIFCYDVEALQIADTVMIKPGVAGIYMTNVADCIVSRVEISKTTEAIFFIGQAERTDFVVEDDEGEEGGEEEEEVGGGDRQLQGQQEEQQWQGEPFDEGAEQVVIVERGDEFGMELDEQRPLEFVPLPTVARTSPMRLLCEDVHVKSGYINIQAHGSCTFNGCTVSASSIGLKAESSFLGRLALHLSGTSFDRAGLLLSGGCEATLSRVRLASGCITAVSNCVLVCEGVVGTLVLLRRLNADKGVARVELRGDANELRVLEEPDAYPTIRKDEYASVEEFCDAFMRESRRHNCCTRVFTGANHLRQPLWECHSCPKQPILCWHCLSEHQGLLHNTSSLPASDRGFCDCDCLLQNRTRK